MANLTIDGKEYDIDSLNEDSKATLASLQFTQAELKRAQAQLAVLKTAEATYANALKAKLEGKE
tara:strand:- start:25 stop:216 length:192 start_codon:yes stop_codon:yes gene_type:complete